MGVISLERDSHLGLKPFSCTFCYPDLDIWYMYQAKGCLKPFSIVERETSETLQEKLKAKCHFQGISSTTWQTFTDSCRRQNIQMPSELTNKPETVLRSAKGSSTGKSIHSAESYRLQTLAVSSMLGKCCSFPCQESHRS